MASSVTDRECSLLRSQLGLPAAPMVDVGVRTTLDFFRNYLNADPFTWISYIRGIDFHSRVEDLTIAPPIKLSRHKSTGSARPKPFAYFTVPGTSQYTTGTSFQESVFERFTVPHRMRCLKSRASGIKFDPEDRIVRSGGGVQFILSSIDASRLKKLA